MQGLYGAEPKDYGPGDSVVIWNFCSLTCRHNIIVLSVRARESCVWVFWRVCLVYLFVCIAISF